VLWGIASYVYSDSSVIGRGEEKSRSQEMLTDDIGS
jgi:hypothetical protein